jgi:hypothetical protein
LRAQLFFHGRGAKREEETREERRREQEGGEGCEEGRADPASPQRGVHVRPKFLGEGRLIAGERPFAKRDVSAAESRAFILFGKTLKMVVGGGFVMRALSTVNVLREGAENAPLSLG